MMLSILGLYNYDPTIFDGFALPDGLDKDTLIGNLLMELGELEVLYPSAPMMKQAIFLWSAKRLWNWQELYKTTQYDYDPLINFDLTEEMTEEGEHASNASGSTDGSSDSSANSKVAGYNSETQVDSDSTTAETSSHAVSESEASGTNKVTRTTRHYGDNSVRSTQFMISEQREIVQFNLSDIIIKEFADRFCIGVW